MMPKKLQVVSLGQAPMSSAMPIRISTMIVPTLSATPTSPRAGNSGARKEKAVSAKVDSNSAKYWSSL